MFYLEFPHTWETQDIFDLFSPFGSIFIGWINERSAFVAIHNQDMVKKAAGQLVGVSGRDYKVYFYSTYINQLSKTKNTNNIQQTPVSSNESKTNLNNSAEKRKRNGKQEKLVSNQSDSSADSPKDKKIKTGEDNLPSEEKVQMV